MRADEGEEQLSYRFLGDSCRVRSRADRWKERVLCVVTHINTS